MFSLLELRNIESRELSLGTFDECYSYLLCKHSYFTDISKSMHIGKLFLEIKNSGSHSFFHYVCMKLLNFWEGMKIDCVRNFYLVNAYSDECSEFYGTCRDGCYVPLFLENYDLITLRRICAILQKIDTDVSWNMRTLIVDMMKVKSLKMLESSRSGDNKLIKVTREILKSGCLLNYDSRLRSFCESKLNSEYALNNFKCLNPTNSVIAQLCRIAFENNNAKPDTLSSYALQEGEARARKSASSQTIALFLPDVLYHPFDEWNSAHEQIFALYSDLLECLPKQAWIIPLMQDYNGAATPNVLSDYAKYIVSYHTGMRDILKNKIQVRADITHIHFKESYFPGAFTFDLSGFSGWRQGAENNVAAQQASSTNKFRLTQKDAEYFMATSLADRKTKYKQAEDDKFLPVQGPKQQIVFYPMQIVDDSVARLANISTLQLLEELVNFAQDLDFMLVIKRHPLCQNPAVQDRLSSIHSLPNVYLSNGHVHDLIKSASIVVVVNSGVGFEALALNARVIATGDSDYNQGVCRVRTASELRDALSKSLSAEKLGKGSAYFRETARDYAIQYLRECVLNLDGSYKKSLLNCLETIIDL